MLSIPMIALLAATAAAAPEATVEVAQPAAVAQPEAAAPVYLIALLDIHDRETYGKYGGGFAEIFRAHGGEILAGSDSPDTLEGDVTWTRTVLIRFESREALDEWYYSPEYQEILKFRLAASTGPLVVLEGRAP
ncbi:MAG: DUF1330 domain-containing protein [Acidobacteriota bacterium]|nr:DUF1330 domain-containing protein [Acidobacteriota bacterium]